MREAIKAPYRPNRNFVGRPDSADAPSFCAHTGAPQGCPLSGSVFSTCTAPLTKMLSDAVGPSAVYAFADDVAVGIKSLRQLPRIHAIFDAFSKATALYLKPAKCILILLRIGGWADAARDRAYANALRRILPAWAAFNIREHSTYLHHDIGPGATLRTQWAQNKYEERTKTFVSSMVGPPLTLQYHETYCARDGSGTMPRPTRELPSYDVESS